MSPYSFDLNPIEPMFHQVKAYLKRHYRAGHANTVEVLHLGCAQVTPAEARRYLRSSGYHR